MRESNEVIGGRKWRGDCPPGVRRNEGKFDFLALVLKFGFEGEGTFTFCKMRWLVGVMTVALNLHKRTIPYQSTRFSNVFGVCGEGGFAATG